MFTHFASIHDVCPKPKLGFRQDSKTFHFTKSIEVDVLGTSFMPTSPLAHNQYSTIEAKYLL
jgi:hypothetical protein